MKAYKNSRGEVMAVFKDWNEKFGIYKRKNERSDFVIFQTAYPKRDTRLEAETDMAATIHRSHDRTWAAFEFKG